MQGLDMKALVALYWPDGELFQCEVSLDSDGNPHLVVKVGFQRAELPKITDEECRRFGQSIIRATRDLLRANHLIGQAEDISMSVGLSFWIP